MKSSSNGLGVVAWVMLGALWMAVCLFGRPGTASAADREFSGEVARVSPSADRMVLNVSDGHSAEWKQVVVSVDKDTRLEGVGRLSELKEGAPVQVEVRKSWYMRQWVLRRLVYVPSESRVPSKDRQELSQTESAGLHDMENRAAHGQMGDIEFETKRQGLGK